MLTISEIKDKAAEFRQLLEICDKNNTSLVIDSFPVMSCKLSSMLLSYHFLDLWPKIFIKGVSAATGKNDKITHYWLEIDDISIDITGGQYNITNDRELNKNIINNRPFPAVHVSDKKESYLYKIFNVRGEESFVSGFPTIGDDFIEKMKNGHKQLMNYKNTI